MQTKKIAVYGASGFGREVVWLIQSCENYDVICFIDDDISKHGSFLNDIPIMSLEETHERFTVHGSGLKRPNGLLEKGKHFDSSKYHL